MMTSMPYADPEKSRIEGNKRAKRYRERHPERVQASLDKWKKNNPEGPAKAAKAWRERNPEKVQDQEQRRLSDPVKGPKKREQAKVHQQGYRKTNAREILSRKYQRKYSITIEQYEALFEIQGGRCSICDKPDLKRRLAVDHCHETNRVRGLLCANCNNGLGRFKHNVKFLERAMFYLSEPSPVEEVA